MYRTLSKCFLEKEYVDKIKVYCKKNRCNYHELFTMVLDDFLDSNKNKTFELKENDYDRMKLFLFKFTVFNDLQDRISSLAREYNIFKTQLLRELIIRYIKKNKLEI